MESSSRIKTYIYEKSHGSVSVALFILTRQLLAEAYELAGVRTELVAEGA